MTAATLPLTVIVAMAQNRVIGRDGKLPWRMSSDLKRFREATMGKPIIMGRRTFAEIGKPLPGRTLIVLSSTSPGVDGILHAHSFEEALSLGNEAATETGAEEIMIGGGSSIYQQAISNPLTKRLLLTVIETHTDGDILFPEINYDQDGWREHSRNEFPPGPKDEFPATVFEYRR